jgi:hypothetical protein
MYKIWKKIYRKKKERTLDAEVAAKPRRQQRWRLFLMLQQVRWAEVEAAKPQKIMISWQPAVWFIEILAGRPFTIHLPYSDMKFSVQ